jgi:DDE superfamily endonuclease
MMRLPLAWEPAARSSACGENASSKNAWPVWKSALVRGGPELFPPELVVQVKALACELPATQGLPLSRWSTTDLAQYVSRSGLVAQISGSTIWRWLHEDAIRPWQHRTWIFPRDPNFALKAGRILDLYQRFWGGESLKDDEFVISADEKTSIQARCRRHPTRTCQPGRPMRVEHEYRRGGAWAYLAALDVHHARLFGRCESKNGIAPFDRLVDQVMTRSPYDRARRVFWIVDNGSAHRGPRAVARLQSRYPRLVLVHGPLHASWLNQIEIYFSIVQRKVLTPNDFSGLDAVAERLLAFQRYYESIAKPFEWKFTRHDLMQLLSKMDSAAA